MRQTLEPLPLIERSEIRSVLAVLEKSGGPAEALLERAQIPAARSGETGHFVSARSTLRFMSLAAQEFKITNLGWRSAIDGDIAQIGSWGARVSRCRTLRESINVFCEAYSQQVTFVDLGLSLGPLPSPPSYRTGRTRRSGRSGRSGRNGFEPGHACLWRRRHLSSKDPEGERQGELFMLGAMIKIVRQVAGETWVPPAIQLESASPDWLRHTFDLSETRLSFNHTALAIAVPLDLLSQPIPRAHGDRSFAFRPFVEIENLGSNLPHDFVGSLETALSSIASERPLSLALGAEIAGTSQRTLRRWLHHEKTTWRDVVDRVRFERSATLLLDPTITIADIAYQVGYTDPAHFTRAFRRWTQESPSEYRLRRVAGDPNL